MFEGVLERVLVPILGKYVDIDKKQLKVGIWSGKIVLNNLKLKENALDELDLPVHIATGYVGRIEIHIPWKNLWTQPAKVFVDGIYLLALPAQADTKKGENKKAVRDKKQAQIEAAEAEAQAAALADSDQKKGTFEKLVLTIVNNIQISVSNLHVRYEDATPSGNFAFGLTLDSFDVRTCDEDGKPSFVSTFDADMVFKNAVCSDFSIYWDCGGPRLAKTRTEDRVDALKENKSASHEYLLEPFSPSLFLRLNNAMDDLSIPKITCQLKIKTFQLQLSSEQYKGIMVVLDRLSQASLRLQAAEFFSDIDSSELHDASSRWSYALACTRETQRRKSRFNFRWDYVQRHIRYRKRYLKLFGRRLLKKNLTAEEQEEFLDIEDHIDVKTILEYRRFALAKSKKVESQQNQWSMWGWVTGTNAQEDPDQLEEIGLTGKEREEILNAFDVGEEKQLPSDFVTFQLEMELHNACLILKDTAMLSLNGEATFSLLEDGRTELMVSAHRIHMGDITTPTTRDVLTHDKSTSKLFLLEVFDTKDDAGFVQSTIKLGWFADFDFIYSKDWVEQVLHFIETDAPSSHLEIEASNWKEAQQNALATALTEHSRMDLQVQLPNFSILIPNQTSSMQLVGRMSDFSIRSFDPSKHESIGSHAKFYPSKANQGAYDGFSLEATFSLSHTVQGDSHMLIEPFSLTTELLTLIDPTGSKKELENIVLNVALGELQLNFTRDQIIDVAELAMDSIPELPQAEPVEDIVTGTVNSENGAINAILCGSFQMKSVSLSIHDLMCLETTRLVVTMSMNAKGQKFDFVLSQFNIVDLHSEGNYIVRSVPEGAKTSADLIRLSLEMNPMDIIGTLRMNHLDVCWTASTVAALVEFATKDLAQLVPVEPKEVEHSVSASSVVNPTKAGSTAEEVRISFVASFKSLQLHLNDECELFNIQMKDMSASYDVEDDICGINTSVGKMEVFDMTVDKKSSFRTLLHVRKDEFGEQSRFLQASIELYNAPRDGISSKIDAHISSLEFVYFQSAVDQLLNALQERLVALVVDASSSAASNMSESYEPSQFHQLNLAIENQVLVVPRQRGAMKRVDYLEIDLGRIYIDNSLDDELFLDKMELEISEGSLAFMTPQGKEVVISNEFNVDGNIERSLLPAPSEQGESLIHATLSTSELQVDIEHTHALLLVETLQSNFGNALVVEEKANGVDHAMKLSAVIPATKVDFHLAHDNAMKLQGTLSNLSSKFVRTFDVKGEKQEEGMEARLPQLKFSYVGHQEQLSVETVLSNMAVSYWNKQGDISNKILKPFSLDVSYSIFPSKKQFVALKVGDIDGTVTWQQIRLLLILANSLSVSTEAANSAASDTLLMPSLHMTEPEGTNAEEHQEPMELAADIDLGRVSLVVINDCQGRNIPVFNFSVVPENPKFWFDGDDKSYTFSWSFAFLFGFFNPRVAVWEPILESSICFVEATHQMGREENTCISIELKHADADHVNLNLSYDSMRTLLQTSSLWTKDLETSLTSTSIQHEGDQIENETRHPVKVRYGDQEFVIKSGKRKSIELPSTESMLDVSVGDWAQIKSVTVGRVRTLMYTLEGGKSNDCVVIQTALGPGNARIITIGSPLQVSNELDHMVEVSIKGMTIVVPARKTKHVPIENASETQFTVKGCPTTFDWGKKHKRVCRFENAETSFAVNYEQGHNDRLMKISFKPALELINLLPVGLVVQATKNGDGLPLCDSTIEPGKSIFVPNADVHDGSIHIRFFNSTKTVRIGTKADDGVSVCKTSDVPMLGTTFKLQLEYDGHAIMKVSLYAQMWVVNHSNLDLEFATSGNKKDLKALPAVGSNDTEKQFKLLGQDKGNHTLCARIASPTTSYKPIADLASTTSDKKSAVLDPESKRSLELSVESSIAPFPFERSRVLKVYPRHLVENTTDRPMHLKQEETDTTTIIPPKSVAPLYFDSRNVKQRLQLTLDAAWSGKFSINDSNEYCVSYDDGENTRVFKVCTRMMHGSFCTSILRTRIPPYVVQNLCGAPVAIKCKNTDYQCVVPNESSHPLVWNSYGPYTIKRHHVELDIDQGRLTNTLDLDNIGLDRIYSMDTLGRVQVTIFVAEGTKVLRIAPESMTAPNMVSNIDDSAGYVRFQVAFAIPSIGISLIDKHPREIALLSVVGLRLLMTESSQRVRKLLVSLENVQLDDMDDSYSTMYPVVFTKKKMSTDPQKEKPLLELRSLDRTPAENSDVPYHLFKYCGLLLQEFYVNLDERFMMNLIHFAMDVAAIDPAEGQEKLDEVLSHPYDLETNQQTLLLYFELLEVYSIKLRLSFTSGRSTGKSNPLLDSIGLIGKNVDNAVLHLKGLKLKQPLLSSDLLAENIVQHYKAQLVRLVFSILGSVKIFGNPRGLMDNVGTGVQDFFSEPAEGFSQGPAQFTVGLAKGSASLVKHSLYGVTNSVVGVTSTVSSAFASLALDDAYMLKRERDKMENKPKNAAHGVAIAGRTLGEGVFGGITGLVRNPMEGAKKKGIGGFFEGIGKGILGLAVKPVTGLTDAATSIIQGVSSSVSSDLSQDQRRRPARMFYTAHRELRPFRLEDAAIQKVLHRLQADHRGLRSEYYAHLLKENVMYVALTSGVHGIKSSKLVCSIKWSDLQLEQKGMILYFSSRAKGRIGSFEFASDDEASHWCQHFQTLQTRLR